LTISGGLFQVNSPALARLLQCGSLDMIFIYSSYHEPEVSAQTVAVLAAALQGCRSLTRFTLYDGYLLQQEHFGALLGALAALPLLQELYLNGDHGATLEVQKVAAGRALGALLAANLPSLHNLYITNCLLGDHGLGPLLDGLAVNTHLRMLDCDGNDPSEAFKRERLDPAQRELAAARLRECSERVRHYRSMT
jgi:hypothetical protein